MLGERPPAAVTPSVEFSEPDKTRSARHRSATKVSRRKSSTINSRLSRIAKCNGATDEKNIKNYYNYNQSPKGASRPLGQILQ